MEFPRSLTLFLACLSLVLSTWHGPALSSLMPSSPPMLRSRRPTLSDVLCSPFVCKQGLPGKAAAKCLSNSLALWQ